jgi:hypothetical protein
MGHHGPWQDQNNPWMESKWESTDGRDTQWVDIVSETFHFSSSLLLNHHFESVSFLPLLFFLSCRPYLIPFLRLTTFETLVWWGLTRMIKEFDCFCSMKFCRHCYGILFLLIFPCVAVFNLMLRIPFSIHILSCTPTGQLTSSVIFSNSHYWSYRLLLFLNIFLSFVEN